MGSQEVRDARHQLGNLHGDSGIRSGLRRRSAEPADREAFEKCTYLKIGVQEAKDQVKPPSIWGTNRMCGQRPYRHLGMELRRIHDTDEHERRNARIQAGVAVAAHRLALRFGIYRTVHAYAEENAEGYKASSAFTHAEAAWSSASGA